MLSARFGKAERGAPERSSAFAGGADCVAVEDAPPGIQSARAVGMRTIGVTNTVSEAELRAAGADIVTNSFADWTVDAVHHLFD